jgi:hypothetical protein
VSNEPQEPEKGRHRRSGFREKVRKIDPNVLTGATTLVGHIVAASGQPDEPTTWWVGITVLAVRVVVSLVSRRK